MQTSMTRLQTFLLARWVAEAGRPCLLRLSCSQLLRRRALATEWAELRFENEAAVAVAASRDLRPWHVPQSPLPLLQGPPVV